MATNKYFNVSPAEQSLIDLQTRAEYALGRISKEELDKRIFDRAKSYTKAHEQWMAEPATAAMYEQQRAAMLQKQEPQAPAEPAFDPEQYSTMDAFADAWEIQKANYRLNELNAQTYAVFDRPQEEVDYENARGRATARFGMPEMADSLKPKEKTREQISQDTLGKLSTLDQNKAERAALQQRIAQMEDRLKKAGPTGILALSDAIKSYKSFLSAPAGWAGSVVGAAGGAYATVPTGGIINPATGAIGGRTAFSAAASVPALLDARNAAFAEAIDFGVPEKDAKDFANAIAATEFGTEFLSGMTSGTANVARAGMKSKFNEWAKSVGREALIKSPTEEMAAELLQQGIKAGLSQRDDKLGQFALEGLYKSKEEAFENYKRVTAAAAVGGGVMSSVPSAIQVQQNSKEVNTRVDNAKRVFDLALAKPELQGNQAGLETIRQQVAARFGLDPEAVYSAQALADRTRLVKAEKGAKEAALTQAVSEIKMTGVEAFDLGQMSAMQKVAPAQGAMEFNFQDVQQTPVDPKWQQKFDQTLEKEAVKVENMEAAPTTTARGFRAQTPIQTGIEGKPRVNFAPTEARTIRAKDVTPILSAEVKQAPEIKPRISQYTKTTQTREGKGEQSYTDLMTAAAKEVNTKPLTKKQTKAVENKAKKASDIAELELYQQNAFAGKDKQQQSDLIAKRTKELIDSGVDLNALEAEMNDKKKDLNQDEAKRLKEQSDEIRKQDQAAKDLARAYGQEEADALISSGRVVLTRDKNIFQTTGDNAFFDGERIYINPSAVRGKGAITKEIQAAAKKGGATPDAIAQATYGASAARTADLASSTIRAVAAHEFGHKARLNADDAQQTPLLKHVAGDKYEAFADAIEKEQSPLAQRARERAAREPNPDNRREELVTYYLEEMEKGYVGRTGAARRLMNDVISKTREMLVRAGVPIKTVRPKDIAYLSMREAKRTARAIMEGKTETGTKQEPKRSIGYPEARGFQRAEKAGKTFTDPVTKKEAFEIDDSNARLTPEKLLREGRATLGETLTHPLLYINYPFLQNIPVTAKSPRSVGALASYFPKSNRIELSRALLEGDGKEGIGALLHEATHAIQRELGLVGGANNDYLSGLAIEAVFREKNMPELGEAVLRSIMKDRDIIKKFDALFKNVYETKKQYDEAGLPMPDAKIYGGVSPDQLQAMMPLLTQYNLNAKEAFEAYAIIRKGMEVGMWGYMMNEGELVARAVGRTFDGDFESLQGALNAMAAQGTPVDSTQESMKELYDNFEEVTKGRKAKYLFSRGLDLDEFDPYRNPLDPADRNQFFKLYQALVDAAPEGRVQNTLVAAGETAKKVKESLTDKVPDERIRILLETRASTGQLYMALMNDLMHRLAKVARAQNVDPKTVDAAWTEMSEKNEQADSGNAEVNSVLMEARALIDRMTTNLLETFEEAGIPIKDKLKQTMQRNMGKYLTRTYEINHDKKWGRDLLRSARRGNERARKIIDDAREYLENNIVVQINNVDSLDKKALQSLHYKLFGTKKGTTKKQIQNIKAYAEGKDTQTLVTDIQNELLRLTKNTQLMEYYQGAARNTGVLERKKKIHPAILALWGQRTAMQETALPTVIKQGRLLAETQFQADLLKRLPDKFSDTSEGNLTAKLPDDFKKYTVLANKYTTPEMYEFLVAQSQMYSEMDAILFDPTSPVAQKALARKTFEVMADGLAEVSMYVRSLVKWNPKNWALNVMGALQSGMTVVPHALTNSKNLSYVGSDGQAVGVMEWMPALFKAAMTGKVPEGPAGELWAEVVSTGVAGAGTSADIKEMYEESVREALRQGVSQKLKTDFASRRVARMGEQFRQAKSGTVHITNVMFNTWEMLATVMNYVSEKNYVRPLWDAEGKSYSDREVQLEAADRVKQTTINRDRAWNAFKTMDKYGATTFMTFFSESIRAPLNRAMLGWMEMWNAKNYTTPEAQAMARKHGFNQMAGAAMMLSFGVYSAKLLGQMLGYSYGEEDDEVEEALPESMRPNMRDIVVVGTGKNGNKLLFDTSQVNTYSALANPMMSALEGDFEGAMAAARELAFINPAIQEFLSQLSDGAKGRPVSDKSTRGRAAGAAIADLTDKTILEDVAPDYDTVLRMYNLADRFIPKIVTSPLDAMAGNIKADREDQALAYYMTLAGATPVEFNIARTIQYSVPEQMRKVNEAQQGLTQVLKREEATAGLIREQMLKVELAQHEMVKAVGPLLRAAVRSGRLTPEEVVQAGFVNKGVNLPAGVQKAMIESIFNETPYVPPPPGPRLLTLSEVMKQMGVESEEEKEKISKTYSRNKELLNKLYQQERGK